MTDTAKHRKSRKDLVKFLLLLAVLAVYFLYLSWKYDFATGGLVSALTWSFFVLCTPVADAGFLIDFPVRLITGTRMFITELFVWAAAITLNLATLRLAPDAYSKSFLTSLLHKILTHPWPYGSIILLCAAGTFLSIRFGDGMMDMVTGKSGGPRHIGLLKMAAVAALVLAIVWTYYRLISSLGISIPL